MLVVGYNAPYLEEYWWYPKITARSDYAAYKKVSIILLQIKKHTSNENDANQQDNNKLTRGWYWW
jgi:hypothetical protein